MCVAHKRAVHQRELVANQLRQVGVQFQAPLLGIKEDPHQAAGHVPEDATGDRINLAADALEPVHEMLLSLAAAMAEPLAERGQPPLAMRQQSQSLFQRAGDEINVPHLAVQVAHERFEPLDR